MERTIVDFTSNDSGIGRIVKAVPKVDSNVEGAHEWDVDVAFTVDEDAADHVNEALPKAGEYLARARDKKGSAVITIKPSNRDIMLSIADTSGENLLEDVAAEIRFMRLNLTEKRQMYVARLRLFSVDAEQGLALVRKLGKPVLIKTETKQIEMDFADVGAPIGVVASGHDGLSSVFGVLRRKEEDKYILDDFGVMYTVTSITSSLSMPEGYEKAAKEYKQKCEDLKERPSWGYLMEALGKFSNDLEITPDIINKAIEMSLPQAV